MADPPPLRGASLKNQTVLGPNALRTKSFYFYFVVQISGNGGQSQRICTATAFQGPMQNLGGASSPNNWTANKVT